MHIDGWTLLLQGINLLVLLALLRWLFYRPLLSVIDARRTSIDAELAKASSAARDVESKAKELADERSKLVAANDELLKAAQAEADRVRGAARQEAARAVDAALAKARQQVDGERRDAARALLDEASTLATALAQRLLAIVPGRPGDANYVAALLMRLRAVTPSERAGWFASGLARALVLASAHPLDAGQQGGAVDSLREIFGAGLQVDFVVDDALLAGAELRMPHGVFALHWAAELARARAQMQARPEATAPETTT